MLSKIKKYYKESRLGRILLKPIGRIYNFYWIYLIPESTYLKHLHKMAFKIKADLDNPKTIQEKILWLRIHNKDPLLTLCSDKYRVRNYVKEKTSEKYLIPIVFQTEDAKDIIATNIPDYPVIVKTNHGCGGHIIIHDKKTIEYRKIQKHFNRLLKYNIYSSSRQWHYKNIKPCILVERLLTKSDGGKVLDYKLHCYNGKVDRIEVYNYHDDGHGKDLIFYTPKWENMNISSRTVDTKGDVPKPRNLSGMIEFAERLAEDFKFVRVDTYNIDGKIYFGELTFAPAMGVQGYRPTKWNTIFGERLQLQN